MARIRRWVVIGVSSGAIFFLVAGLLYAWNRAPGATATAVHEDDQPTAHQAGETASAHDDEQAADGAPGAISLSAEARANIGLSMEPAKAGVVERTLLLNATLQVHPDREAFVSSRVQGKVTAVNANVSDVVARGTPLVIIQSLQIAETPPTVPVVSPLSGVVLERMVTVGETVDPSKSLMHVADLSRIVAEAEVYEADLANVRVGQPARLRVASYPDRPFVGRVVRLGDVIDPARRTLRVWIEVANTPDRKLKPDMFAQANLVVSASGRVVTVPNEAVQTEGPERFVFVQSGDRVERRNIVVGDRDDRVTAVMTGVRVGETVVTRGAAELKTVVLRPAGGLQDESKPHAH